MVFPEVVKEEKETWLLTISRAPGGVPGVSRAVATSVQPHYEEAFSPAAASERTIEMAKLENVCSYSTLSCGIS